MVPSLVADGAVRRQRGRGDARDRHQHGGAAFDSAFEVAEKLDSDPDNDALRMRYHRARARARSAQRDYFHAAVRP